MIGKMKCQCGHPNCKDWWLTGIGSFVQGSGFSEEEADRIIAALNAAPAAQVAATLATQPAARRVTEEDVARIIERVERENSADGMDGDTWDRLLVRAALESFAQSGAGSSSTSSDLAAEGVSE